MSAFYKCDGCGAVEPAVHYGHGKWHKPDQWFTRGDDDGVQDACSRACIDKIAATSGKTRVTLPW